MYKSQNKSQKQSVPPNIVLNVRGPKMIQCKYNSQIEQQRDIGGKNTPSRCQMRHLFHHHRWDQSKVNHIMPPLIWWDSMEGLQLVTIHFKNSASSFIFYLYCTMEKMSVIMKGPSQIDRSLLAINFRRELNNSTCWPIWNSLRRSLES